MTRYGVTFNPKTGVFEAEGRVTELSLTERLIFGFYFRCPGCWINRSDAGRLAGIKKQSRELIGTHLRNIRSKIERDPRRPTILRRRQEFGDAFYGTGCPVPSGKCLEAKGLKVFTSDQRVVANDQEVTLFPQEYRLLVFMLEHKDRAHTPEELGEVLACPPKTAQAHLSRLRQKLRTVGVGRAVKTVAVVKYQIAF